LDVFRADGTPAPLDTWALTRALRGETATNAEYILRRKDTGEMWVGSYNFAPIRDKGGVIAGSVLVVRDITERTRSEVALRRSESRLRESEARYRAVVDDQIELVCRYEPDTTITFANRAFAEFYGHRFDDLIGSKLIELHPLAMRSAELERLANHFGDIGAICNDASFVLMYAHCGILRELVLRAGETCFGHRLMMDRVIPGGVTTDLSTEGVTALRDLTQQIRDRFPLLIELYDNTASLQDRTAATGILDGTLARRFGAAGFVGRASGRDFDARKTPGYPPYSGLDFTVPVLTAGDVNARVWIRIREVEQSLALVEQMLERLPQGPIAAAFDAADRNGEGLALVEGFRGDVLVSLRLKAGHVARCHLRDPSWFQWPLLEVAIEGNIVADFPLCNKSFNCSYSGHDS